MKARFLLLFLVSGIVLGAMGQSTIDLTFTAVDNVAYIRLDSIKVMNRTQGDSVKLYWPDTTLTYQITAGDLLLFIGYAVDYPVGVQSISNTDQKFKLFQIYPNPVRDQAVISIYLPSKRSVNMMVADVRGRIAVNVDRKLDEGIHSFRFRPGDEGIYFLTARWNGNTQSIKILTEGPTGSKTCKLEYIGPDHKNPTLKQSRLKAGLMVQESGILDTPDNDTTYTFQFATNIPCPGTPTVEYEGQVYNTIQVFSQCWLKENLNVGTMINGNQYQTNNAIKEKYCYNNELDSCTKYGGLYQWDEIMEYTTQQGARGICPPGWHLPTDEEWKVLEGAVDSWYGIGDPDWDIYWDYRGYDAGRNLKTTSGWYENGNGTDLFGFSGLPGGSRYYDGFFSIIGYFGRWWTSSVYVGNDAWNRALYYLYPEVGRYYFFKGYGFSVRCSKDY
jgi:uncharacterized protein (TIGR02145 family)